MSEKDKWIRKLEEDIDDLRRETDRKIETLRKMNLDGFAITMMLTDALHALIMDVAPSEKGILAQLRFIKEITDETKKLDIEEGLKTYLITSTAEISRSTMEMALRSLASMKFPFNKMMDLLLRGLGRDLVKQLVSPDLIAELWGFPSVETFKKTISEVEEE